MVAKIFCRWLGLTCLVFCALGSLAQNDPVCYLSKNTIISLLQDKLVKQFNDPSIKTFVYCAPSFCDINDSVFNFIQVIASKDVNHNKIASTTYCGDINDLKMTLATEGNSSFILLNGSVKTMNNSIVIPIDNGYGNTSELDNLTRQLIQK